MSEKSHTTAVAEPPGASEHPPGALRHHRADKKETDRLARGEHGVDAPPRKKRGPVFWLVLSVLLIGGGVWVARFIDRSLTYEETDDAFVAGHVHTISSRISGDVQEVLVTENQVVKANDPLVRLDPLETQLALKKAEAALDKARADEAQSRAALAEARADAGQAKAQVTQAEAQVQETSARLQVANVNFGRDTRLFQNDARAVAKADLDTTRSTAEATTASLEGAKASLEAAKAKAQSKDAAVESAQALLESNHAAVDSQEAAVLDAKRELSYTTISAPTDGRIGNKSVETGNRIQSGQALFALVEPAVWVTANFKETQLRKMQPGQPVEITIDALGGRMFTGKLDSVSPASGAQFAMLPPDNATGNFTKVVQRVPAKIVFDAESIRGFEDRIRPGFSVVVSVRVK